MPRPRLQDGGHAHGSRPAGPRAERAGVLAPGHRQRCGRPALQLYVQPPAYTTAAPYGAGHCNFATDQYVAVIRALDGWVGSGTRPDAATLSTLFSAHPGALNLDDKPALWPAR